MSLFASSLKDSQTVWEKDWANYLAESFITPHSFPTQQQQEQALMQ
jgi:hypothetical protein